MEMSEVFHEPIVKDDLAHGGTRRTISQTIAYRHIDLVPEYGTEPFFSSLEYAYRGAMFSISARDLELLAARKRPQALTYIGHILISN